jgi:hypothetical protein
MSVARNFGAIGFAGVLFLSAAHLMWSMSSFDCDWIRIRASTQPFAPLLFLLLPQCFHGAKSEKGARDGAL